MGGAPPGILRYGTLECTLQIPIVGSTLATLDWPRALTSTDVRASVRALYSVEELKAERSRR
jgi:hypothetical protein